MRHGRPGPRPCPRAHSIAAKVIAPSVSVPVLSRQTTSTRARPSTAGSSWTSTLRRARLSAPTKKAMLVSSTRPSGHHPHQGGHRAHDGVGGALVAPGQLADEQDGPDDDEGPADVAQQGVDALHQLRAGLREALRLGRQPLGVGVGADGRRLEACRPRPRRSSRRAPRSPAPCRWGRTRRSGATRRPPARPRSTTRPSDGHLVARAQPHQVAEHDLADRELRVLRRRARPSRRGAFSTARRSRVRLARSSWMMPMSGVPDDDQAEERVGR